MALVTIQRSPSPSADQDLDQTDSSEDINDGKSQMKRSLSQSYFTVKGAALILPHTEFTKKSAKKSHGGEIQNHLQAMLHLLRPDDTIQIAIRLEDINQYQRYIALVSSKGRQDTEEAVILGIDCNNTEASIGLVLPVWMGLKITLGGDGGFSVCTDEQCYIFNPVSVQAMWSAIQSLVKFQRTADEMKYIPDGLTHTWVGYYKSIVSPRDSAPINQWNVEGVEVFAPSSLSIKPNDADEKIKQTISSTLKEVMMTVDLDEATSIMLRRAVEEKMSISLADFKSYFDEEMMRILGQMDKPSEILDFLYLGSEWNASNLEELLANGIGYILNVTKEIDNFFEGRFHYYSVRVTDEETSDLLTSWEKTFRFISKARSQKSKVLVHCKMGVSRSASTVMAFLMKDRRWSVEEAFSFVKERRSCVHPNSGFMDQLSMYEAILIASNKRDIFRHKSEQNLLEENAKDEADNTEGSFLGDSLFRMMSHSDWQSAGGGVAHEEEWIDSSQKDETHDADAKTDKDLETGSCSAESTEDVFPDLSSPSAETTITAGNLTSLMTPSSLPSTWSSLKATSLDFEIAQESRSISRTPPARAVCLSESSGLTHLQASASAQSSRIKPDSSWIRLDSIDTELDQTDSHDTVPSCESYDSAQPNLSASDTAVTETKETLIPSQEILENISNIKEDSTSIPAATTVPEPLPYFPASGFETNSVSSDKIFSDRIQTSAHFYIGDTHPSLNIAPAVPSTGIFPSGVALKQSGSFSSISSYNPAEKTSSIPIPVSCDHTVPQILQDSSRKQEPVAWQTSPSKFNNEAVDTVGYDGQIMKTREDAAGIGADTSDSSSILAGSPQDKIQFDGYQQFLGEQTAFKLGKIAKIPEDISKSDQVSHKTNEDNKSRKAAEVIQISLVAHNESEASDDNLLLNKIPDHLSATTMFHSHSCMELCTHGEGDVTITPLYEREKIQVTPGTVLRTKFEIEERQRFFSGGEGDQEVFNSSHPVLRTSSLKHSSDAPRSRYTQSRRLSGPILPALTGQSLDDLQSVGANEEKELSQEPYEQASQDQIENAATKIGNELENHLEPDTQSSHTMESNHGADMQRSHSMKNKSEPETILPQNTVTHPDAIPLTRPQSSFSLNNNLTFEMKDNASAETAEDKRPDPASIDSRPESSRKGNVYSETLALIREIGSAMSTNPTSPKQDDTNVDKLCTNVVRYFVRKIDSQSKVCHSPCNIGFNPRNARELTSSGIYKSRKPSAVCDNINPDKINTTAQPTPTKSGSRKSSDFPSVSVISKSEAYIDLSSHPEKHEDFSSSTCGQNMFKPGSNDNSGLDSKKNDHKLLQTHGSGLEIKHNTTSPILFIKKTEEEATKTVGFEPTPTYSPGQSFGHDLSEPSIVRHLVGKFDIRSPEYERGPLEFGSESTPKFKDSQSDSQPLQFTCEKVPPENSNIIASSPEEYRNQPSSSELLFKQKDSNLSPHSPSASLASMIAPSVFSPPPSFSKEHSPAEATQNPLSSITKNLSTFDIDVSSPELAKNNETYIPKDMLYTASSSFVEPDPLTQKHSDKSDESKSTSQASKNDFTLPDNVQRKIDVNLGNVTHLDDVFMRKVSNEGRKIRRLHGKSHPVTKLSNQQFGRGPFYSSM